MAARQDQFYQWAPPAVGTSRQEPRYVQQPRTGCPPENTLRINPANFASNISEREIIQQVDEYVMNEYEASEERVRRATTEVNELKKELNSIHNKRLIDLHSDDATLAGKSEMYWKALEDTRRAELKEAQIRVGNLEVRFKEALAKNQEAHLKRCKLQEEAIAKMCTGKPLEINGVKIGLRHYFESHLQAAKEKREKDKVEKAKAELAEKEAVIRQLESELEDLEDSDQQFMRLDKQLCDLKNENFSTHQQIRYLERQKAELERGPENDPEYIALQEELKRLEMKQKQAAARKTLFTATADNPVVKPINVEMPSYTTTPKRSDYTSFRAGPSNPPQKKTIPKRPIEVDLTTEMSENGDEEDFTFDSELDNVLANVQVIRQPPMNAPKKVTPRPTATAAAPRRPFAGEATFKSSKSSPILAYGSNSRLINNQMFSAYKPSSPKVAPGQSPRNAAAASNSGFPFWAINRQPLAASPAVRGRGRGSVPGRGRGYWAGRGRGSGSGRGRGAAVREPRATKTTGGPKKTSKKQGTSCGDRTRDLWIRNPTC